MQRNSVFSRSVVPVLVVLPVAVVSMLAYFNLRALGDDSGFSFLTRLSGIVYFISVAFGTLFVYSRSYIGGAPLKERILASSVVPFFWMTKEVIRLTESHPFLECIYWYLNPLNVWLVTLMILEMGIATLVSRRILRGRGQNISVISAGPLAVILCSLIFVISVYAWGRGENIYVIFLNGYRLIFGSGVS